MSFPTPTEQHLQDAVGCLTRAIGLAVKAKAAAAAGDYDTAVDTVRLLRGVISSAADASREAFATAKEEQAHEYFSQITRK